MIVAAGGGVPLLCQQFGDVLTILFGTPARVLMIACANLANLLLARAHRGQAAIRLALGILAASLAAAILGISFASFRRESGAQNRGKGGDRPIVYRWGLTERGELGILQSLNDGNDRSGARPAARHS